MKNIKTLLTVCMALMILPAFVSATTVDTYWDGSGTFDTYFVSEDAESFFSTGGNYVMGEFHGKDYNDNPYGYNVDTYHARTEAFVNNGGFIEFETLRTDSKASYGNAGQYSYSYMSTSDGTAEMAWNTKTNYASMSNCQYGLPTTSGNKNFEATGTNYMINHLVKDSDSDGAQVMAYGSGSAQIKLQGEKASGSSFNMGSLKVCGDNCAWKDNYATFTGTGSGDFEVHSWADNGITVGCPDCGSSWSIPGDGTDNSATYDMHVGYTGTWSMPDFGVRGN